MSAFLAWVDRRHFVSVRGLTMYVTLGITVYVTIEAFRFAYASELPGIDIAAILAAITAPCSALQGYVFSAYMKGKPE